MPQEYSMPGLNQIQLTYIPQEDRLLLSLQTQDFLEYRFWITRYLIKPFWHLLMELLKADRKSAEQHRLESELYLKSILDERDQHRPIADKLSQHIAKQPFGTQAYLISKISGKPAENHTSILHFEDIQGNFVECAGDSTIIIAICQLILQTIKIAQWDLTLEPLPF